MGGDLDSTTKDKPWGHLIEMRIAQVALASLIAASAFNLADAATAAAACTEQLAYADHHPQTAADGARGRWVARLVSATDWAVGGFASEVLWVGTDNAEADVRWVEVGITHGFAGTNVYTFYTARRNATGYSEARWNTLFPSVGSSYLFTVTPGNIGRYRAHITLPNGTVTFYEWSGHNPNTVDYSGGFEATCNSSRVDRVYVSSHHYRDKATAAWRAINSGSLIDQSSDGGIAWCLNPQTYRYFLHSQRDPTLCQA